MRALLLLLVACSLSPDGSGSACAEAADCRDELACIGPQDFLGCGVAPTEDCASDGDCGGLRCHAVEDSCSSDGVGSQCGEPCGLGDCGEAFFCEDGTCVASTCVDDPAVCGANQVCDPASVDLTGPVWGRHHGCRDVQCADDEACAEGQHCVNRICQTEPGECQEYFPPP